MNQERFLSHRIANLLQTGIILASILGLTGFLGWILWGTSGLFWSLAVSVILLALSPRLSPATILRLYRAAPLSPPQAPALYAVVKELARRGGMQRTPRLFLIPSPMMNAFAVGSGNDYAIALTHGLLKAMDLREMTGILAHEMSHIRHNDLRVMTLADTSSRITSLLSTFGQILLLINLPLILTGAATLPFLPIIILILAPTITALLQLALSRSREFDADLQAARLTGDPLGLARALEKMEYSRGGLLDRIFLPGRKEPDPSLLRTHPATGERIERLRDLADHIAPDSHPPMSIPRPGERFMPPGGFPQPRHRPRWHIGGFWY